MGCGCGGGGGARGRSRVVPRGNLSSTPQRPRNFGIPQVAPPQVFGMVNLPTPQINNDTAQKRIKELNKQAVRRARGF